jgi:hypothetical protein
MWNLLRGPAYIGGPVRTTGPVGAPFEGGLTMKRALLLTVVALGFLVAPAAHAQTGPKR